MNWGRGLTRIWVVGSVLWALGLITHFLLHLARSTSGTYARAEVSGEEVGFLVLAIVAPPLLILAAAFVATRVGTWIVRGFRPKDH